MQLDPEFTAQMEGWLSTPRAERDVVEGADLLFRITGNRRFLNQAIVRPDSVHDHIEADLRKHLDIRERGHNPQTLHQLERSLLHHVGEALSDDADLEPSDSAGEQETVSDREQEESVTAKRGRRPDHEQLAPEVQTIVEENARRYEHMRTLYNRLVSMADAEPCDRHEDILQLDRLYKAWGEAWSVYDAAQPQQTAEAIEPSNSAGEQETVSDREQEAVYDREQETGDEDEAEEAEQATVYDLAKKIAAAKRYLQKHRKKLRTLQESADESADESDAVRTAIDREAQLIAEKESELSQLTNP